MELTVFYHPLLRLAERVTDMEFNDFRERWSWMISGPFDNFTIDGKFYGKASQGPLSVDWWDEWLIEATKKAGIPITIH